MTRRTRTVLEAPAVMGGEERNQRGQFLRGNKAGRGRGSDPLRIALREAITPEDLEAVVSRLIASAKKGSVRAAQLLFSYAIGTPRQVQSFGNVTLPKLDGAESCAEASTVIAEAAATGALGLDDARAMAELLGFASDQYRLAELESDLEALRARLEFAAPALGAA